MDCRNGTMNEKLERFRALFTHDDIVKNAGGAIDAYLLPSTDPHQVCDFIQDFTSRNRNGVTCDDDFCRNHAKVTNYCMNLRSSQRRRENLLGRNKYHSSKYFFCINFMDFFQIRSVQSSLVISEKRSRSVFISPALSNVYLAKICLE